MRSRNQKIRQILGRISPMTTAAKNIISLGIEGKQWLACVMICAMLSPIFALPAGASVRVSSNETSGEFEAVNEKLPIWSELWRDLNAKVEALTTPLRAENISFGDDDNDKKKKKKKDEKKKEVKSEEKADKPQTDEKIRTENAEAKTVEKTVSNKLELKAKVENAIAPIVPFFNQLPDNERGSIYSFENNVGGAAAYRQPDSSNQAAATSIKHRIGIANFSFGLSLAGLSGRGMDAGVGMIYNSRTWNKSVNANNEDHYTYDVEQSWIAPGFSTGFGYLESQAFLRNAATAPPDNWHTEITPLGLTDPDGGRHQLECKTYITIGGIQRCSVYGTNDGTFIEFAAKSWIDNPNNSTNPYIANYANATWATTYPNGTKIWYSGGFGSGQSRKHYPYIIQDSNGNRIRITYKSDQSGRIDFITDTLNRQIKFYYENDTNGNPDKLVTITIPGIGTNDVIQTVRFYYETMTLNAAGKFVGEITAPATIRVLRYVYMPATKTGYKYDYNSNYGMINKITRLVGMAVDGNSTTSTGAVIPNSSTDSNSGLVAATTEYNYPDGLTALTDVPKYTKRTDDWQGRTASSPQETLYSVSQTTNGDSISRITVKDDGFDVLTESISNSSGLLGSSSVKKLSPTGTLLQLMSQTDYTWSGTSRLASLTTTNDAGLSKVTDFEYDQYDNQKNIKEHDFASPTGTRGTLLRTTDIEYETGAGWINNKLWSLPKSVKTIVGGVTVSKTLYEYDHNGSDSTLTPRSDIDTSTHDTLYNPAHPAWIETICPIAENGCITINHPGYSAASAYRGNVTKVTAFSDATLTTDANADVTNYNYDITGNLVSGTLSCCTLRTYAYDKDHEYAFPISQTSGTAPTQLTTSATYNRNTGLMLTSTDENSQVTSYEYETDTLRQKKVNYPNGGYVQTEYSDKLVTNTNDLLPGFVRTTTTLETNRPYTE